jgi:hypothetical protein
LASLAARLCSIHVSVFCARCQGCSGVIFTKIRCPVTFRIVWIFKLRSTTN